MPELPEVETVKRTLEPHLQGKKIIAVEIYHPGVIAFPGVDEFCKLIEGKTIQSLGRRGKYLIIQLSGGYYLVAHLRMTGRLVLAGESDPLASHTHIIFALSKGLYLHWVDTRRFGRLYLAEKDTAAFVAGLNKLGAEPLDDSFDRETLAAICSGRQRPLKQILLDQQLLAGIGNIYADEMLFLAGLSPMRPGESLSRDEIDRLYEAMQAVLQQGIANQGTSIKDYVDGFGQRGKNQDFLKVYGRAGKPCTRCGTVLVKKKIGGRSTCYCPLCQG